MTDVPSLGKLTARTLFSNIPIAGILILLFMC